MTNGKEVMAEKTSKKASEKLPSVMEQLNAPKPMSPIESVARAAAFAEAQALIQGEVPDAEVAKVRPSARLVVEKAPVKATEPERVVQADKSSKKSGSL